MSLKPEQLDAFGRFTEPAVMILVSLAGQPRHGYAISQDIEQLTGHKPGPGTLYGAIGRLETRGFIRPIESEGTRCTYELTAVGSQALKARLAAMERVTRVGIDRLATA
ncbi:MAG: PadR family transcriptional regulator [Pseudomonadota bacterium]